VNSKNNDKSASVQNVDIFKKLKQIHDKIKRLNKTFTDPKVNKLHEKTLKFLAKNNKKFLNMTNEIGIIGKKLSEKKKENLSNPLHTSSPGHKAKPTVSSFEDLENEIEKFFASKDTIGKQVDELDSKLKSKQSHKAKITLKQSKDDYQEENVDDLLAINKINVVKTKKKKPAKELKIDLNSPKKLVHEENLTNDDDDDEDASSDDTENLLEAIKDESKVNKNKGKNDWLKALEKLDEELDLGEKIISKDDPLAVDSIISSRTSVSDSLAELMPDNRNNLNQGQAAHLSVLSSGSASASNAHLQDLSHTSESQQSSSTG
jgi:hypothetical protein